MSDEVVNAEVASESKSRRGMVRYKENPFVVDAANATTTRAKRISNSRGDRMMVVNQESGEYLGEAGFWQYQEVDSTQFVKLFINGVRAIKELTGAGTKVFEVLYLEVQKQIGKDEVTLSFHSLNQESTPMSRSTFNSGMTELLRKGFIAESLTPFRYYINPDYLWNGDRLAFVKEYRLKPKPRDVVDRESLEARGQQRLIQ